MGVLEPTLRAALTASCPCGSGRQYRRCCWAAERRAAAAVRDEIVAVTGFALRWAEERFPDQAQEATDRFFDLLEQRWKRALAKHLMDSSLGELLREAAADCFVADVRVDGSRTPLDLLLVDPATGPKLSPPVVDYLRSWRRRAISLYEVEDVAPGEGIEVRDLLSGQRLKVLDRTVSQTIKRWTILFARFAEVDGTWVFTAFALVVIGERLEWLLGEVRRLRNDISPSVTWQRFLKREWELVPALFFEAHRPIQPDLRTTDDEELVFISHRLRLADPSAVSEARSRLQAAAWLEYAEGESWRIAEQRTGGSMGVLLAGSVHLEETTVVVEVMSREREERLLPRITELLQGLVTGSERTEQIPGEEMLSPHADAGTSDASDSVDLPPEVQAEIVMQFSRRWLDEAVPALDGLTPREAARDPAHRATLRRLLKDIELQTSRQLPEGAWDPGWMWRELGLKR